MRASLNLRVRASLRFSCCGAQRFARASLPRGVWGLSASGMRRASPELAGGFFTREPPGRPSTVLSRSRFRSLLFGRAGSRAAESRAVQGVLLGLLPAVASLLQSAGSRAHGLSRYSPPAPERRPSSCDARASLSPGMCDPPGPGIKPASPALAGDPLSAVPPGNSELVINFTLQVHLAS